MKRYLVLFSASLIMGIISADAAQSCTTKPHVYLIVTIVSLLFICVFISIFILKSRQLMFVLLGLAIFYAAGAFKYIHVDNAIVRKFECLDGAQVLVRGRVYSRPEFKGEFVRYEIAVEEIMPTGNQDMSSSNDRGIASAGNRDSTGMGIGYNAETNDRHDTSSSSNYTAGSKSGSKPGADGGKMLLNVYGHDLLLDYGTRVNVSGVLSVPKTRRNPGSLDYKKYLASFGISATMYAKRSNVEIENPGPSSPIAGILARIGGKMRERIQDAIVSSLPENQAVILAAMLTGCRDNVPDDMEENFNDSGLIHILTVSGMHVGFIILPFAFIFKKLGLRKQVANPVIILILFLYILVTGPQAPVLRAAIMASTVLVGQMIRREADTLTSISLALIVLLLWRPHMLFNAGFQLSFMATGSIVLFGRNTKNLLKSRRIPGYISDALATILPAQAGILPLTAVHFNKLPVISVFANLLAAPVSGAIIILGMAMAVLGQVSIHLSRLIGYVNNLLLSYLLFVSEATAKMPFSVFRVTTPSILLIIIYYFILWFLLWFKPTYKVRVKWQYHAIAVILVISLAIIAGMIPGELEVVFLDVGEGDCAFIKTPSGKTLLIDGGGKKGSDPGSADSMGNRTIIPFLLEYGITRLDAVVATHAHDDHLNGIIPVLEQIKVEMFIMPGYVIGDEFDRALNACARRKINVIPVREGDSMLLGKDVRIEILNPPAGAKNGELSLNNSSIVLILKYRDVEILFTGDIEGEIEARLARSILHDTRADVLKVPHHGSDTSSTPVFLEKVHPKVAVVSVGNNNYGHPSAEVMDRLAGTGTKIFRTDLNGAVILGSNGKRIRIKVMCKDRQG
ncbi:MAG: DNA internalization-related competence protein ComEC/Rec2 [Clostridiaceae bacterium]|nr:DNA internalization-related competence protein ComEC/Rec2 [Clostridiaceae bacterium]